MRAEFVANGYDPSSALCMVGRRTAQAMLFAETVVGFELRSSKN